DRSLRELIQLSNKRDVTVVFRCYGSKEYMNPKRKNGMELKSNIETARRVMRVERNSRSQNSNYTISLINGQNSSEGTVIIENRINGQRGAVCGTAWHASDASVVCRQLGFLSYRSKASSYLDISSLIKSVLLIGLNLAFIPAVAKPGNLSIIARALLCLGNEQVIDSCTIVSWNEPFSSNNLCNQARTVATVNCVSEDNNPNRKIMESVPGNSPESCTFKYGFCNWQRSGNYLMQWNNYNGDSYAFISVRRFEIPATAILTSPFLRLKSSDKSAFIKFKIKLGRLGYFDDTSFFRYKYRDSSSTIKIGLPTIPYTESWDVYTSEDFKPRDPFQVVFIATASNRRQIDISLSLDQVFINNAEPNIGLTQASQLAVILSVTIIASLSLIFGIAYYCHYHNREGCKTCCEIWLNSGTNPAVTGTSTTNKLSLGSETSADVLRRAIRDHPYILNEINTHYPGNSRALETGCDEGC
ncbi:hypothetical protein TrispH2_009056, partial [Trichoplax sp. H2]